MTAVSQTAGPETVLAGEAEIPYALLGYATDYANGVHDERDAGGDPDRADRRQRRVLRDDPRRGRAEDRAAVALALPAPAAAWGPPKTGKFGPNVLRGGPGADFLRGGEGNDRVLGRGGDDLLTGDTGPDTVGGGAGKDTITGGSGIDVLSGGDGDDIASGGFGADVIDGGPGGDALDGNQDADAISGGPGDDLLHGGSGIDRIDGGAGSDRIFADSGGDRISAGDGDDVIVVDGASAAHVSCGAGADIVYVTVPSAATADYAGSDSAGKRDRDCEEIQITDAIQDPNKGLTYLAADAGGARSGTARDDVLLGGPGPDTLRGLGGNDVLWGLRQAGLTSSQPDVIDAGPGDDTVYGGPGPQRISGGRGDDFLEGGLGDGTIDGGAGNDTIRLRGGGAVVVRAGAGRDTIFARGGSRATISCGSGRDTATVDAGDKVARDCELVNGKRRSRARPRRVAAVRARAASARAAAPTYADLVAATPGLRHWWRMARTEEVIGYGGSVYYTSGLVDRITKLQGSGIEAVGYGPTDDGDSASESHTPPYQLYTGVQDSALHGAFTFEGWLRPDPSGAGVARDILESSADLALEADGSLHATVSSYQDPRRAEVRTAPLVLTDRWHHVALTRTDDRIAIYVDGVVAAEAPAEAVTHAYASSIYFGGSWGPNEKWIGGLDELAIYDRALDAATIHGHARVGEDGRAPVTQTYPAFGPLQSKTAVAHFVTAKGGSSYRCGLDGAPLARCAADHVMTNLAVGPHVLRVLATDRFGLVESTPAVLRFTVDLTLPRTIALVRIASDGDRRAVLSMGSDKPGGFQCSYTDPASPFFSGIGSFWEDFSYSPCNPGDEAFRGLTLRVRAVDTAGNRDPSPVTISVPRLGQGFQGPETGLPTFAGARAEVGISGRLPVDLARPYDCRHDGGAWAPCSFAFRMPIQHAGRHTLQARQRQPGGGYLTTRELATTVSASRRNTTIVGLQMTLVLERSAALARRSPRVRFALNRPAVLRVDIMRGRKRLVKVVAKGVVGANTIKLPTRKLRSLPTGRYGLVIVARGTSGPVAVQRLPLALVRPLR